MLESGAMHRLLRSAILFDLPGFIAEAPELGFFCRRTGVANGGRHRIVLEIISAQVPRGTTGNPHAK